MVRHRLLSIAVAGALTVLLCSLVEGVTYSGRAIGVAVGLVTLITLGAYRGPSLSDRRFFFSVLSLVAILSLVVIVFGPFQKRLFGDGGALIRTVSEGAVYPRWLGITSILRFLYQTLGLHTFLDADTFIRLMSWGSMVGGFAIAGRMTAASFPFLLLLTVPLNLVFFSGHIEVYPALTGLLVVAFGVLERWSLDRAGAVRLTLLAALLPWLYLGFIPLGAAIVGVACIARLRVGVAIGLIAAGLFLALTAFTWSGGFENFLVALSSQIDTGDGHLIPRYRRIVPEHASIYFPLDVALSAVHLQDLGWMILYGAGWCIPLVCILCVPRVISIIRGACVRRAAGAGGMFLLGTSVFYLHYLFFMIPRRGPLKDLDLFFVSYLVVTYSIGRLLVPSEQDDVDSRSREVIFWSSLTGGAILVTPLIVR